MKITLVRNLAFHRKGFAMLKTAFDLWCEHIEPVQYEGVDVKPDFETFREKLTIQAGFYTVAFDLRGKVTFKAESLSFASMSEERFAKVYSAYIDTILDQVLVGIIERKALDAAVERIIGFA